MFKNENLEAKVNAIQAEFNALLNDKSKYNGITGDDGLHMDEFYQVMGEFYGGNMKRHESPTRRLRQQKHAAVEHKTYLYKKLQSGEISKDDYTLTYVASPQKTYMIQPKKGEIDYSLAERNLDKFYDKVLSQDVTEHKVSKKRISTTADSSGLLPQKKRVSKAALTMESRVCKRAVGRILVLVKHKLLRMISQARRELEMDDVAAAMDHPEAQEVVQKYIANEGIKLRHRTSNAEVFTRQMSKIGEMGQQAAEDSDDEINEDLEPEDALLVSDFLTANI